MWYDSQRSQGVPVRGKFDVDNKDADPFQRCRARGQTQKVMPIGVALNLLEAISHGVDS